MRSGRPRHSRLRSASPSFLGVACALVALAVETGCHEEPAEKDASAKADEVTRHRSRSQDALKDASAKAREITRHRRLSREALARYKESRSVDDLLEVVKHQRITTEIAPSTCPTCYRDYGKALSMAARHYYYEMADARKQVELASDPAEIRAAQASAEESEQKMREFFERSYRAYSAFFQHPETKQRSPEDCFRVMKDAELLGNWARAQEYLGYFTSAVGDEADANTRKAIEELARRYQQNAEVEDARR